MISKVEYYSDKFRGHPSRTKALFQQGSRLEKSRN